MTGLDDRATLVVEPVKPLVKIKPDATAEDALRTLREGQNTLRDWVRQLEASDPEAYRLAITSAREALKLFDGVESSLIVAAEREEREQETRRLHKEFHEIKRSMFQVPAEKK